MAKFQNKYRITSARAPWWDYAWRAAYFVTICTKNRECFFGNVIDGQMVLSEIGKIVESEWLKTFEMRPDMNLMMGEFVVMPNHFHAIIGIGDNQYNTEHKNNDNRGNRSFAMHCESTIPTSQDTTIPKNQFGPQSKNLASIIRGFKIGVTRNARLLNHEFAWQARYHDHIIRNDKSYQKIAAYIKSNPKNWVKDDLNKS